MIFDKLINKFNKSMIYLLTSSNTEERIAQNIYIHNNSNRNCKRIKPSMYNYKDNNINLEMDRLWKNYKKQCPGLDFFLLQN